MVNTWGVHQLEKFVRDAVALQIPPPVVAEESVLTREHGRMQQGHYDSYVSSVSFSVCNAAEVEQLRHSAGQSARKRTPKTRESTNYRKCNVT